MGKVVKVSVFLGVVMLLVVIDVELSFVAPGVLVENVVAGIIVMLRGFVEAVLVVVLAVLVMVVSGVIVWLMEMVVGFVMVLNGFVVVEIVVMLPGFVVVAVGLVDMGMCFSVGLLVADFFVVVTSMNFALVGVLPVGIPVVVTKSFVETVFVEVRVVLVTATLVVVVADVDRVLKLISYHV